MPLVYEDQDIRIIKVAHMGPVDNNGYILSCRQTGEAVIIDAPAEPEKTTERGGGCEGEGHHHHPSPQRPHGGACWR